MPLSLWAYIKLTFKMVHWYICS